MKKIALIALFGTILLTSNALAGVVEDAQSDYQWRLSLVTEQTQRLDMWYAANGGKEITSGQLTSLKSDVDEFIKRENDAIEIGRKYRNALIGNIDNYNREWVLAEINRTEKNEDISNSDKSIVTAKYDIEAQLLNVLTKIQTTKIKETTQEITLGSLDETRTIEANEFLVYSFMGTMDEKINVNIDVTSGGAIDVFLMASTQFTEYQSMMLGGSSKEFTSIPPGEGKNVKSKSYKFIFPIYPSDRYYIAIDNTIQPNGGANPSGRPVDVKIKITHEEALSTPASSTSAPSTPAPSIPGFEAIYSILLFTIVFYLFRKY